jgi:hypothetical protein
MPGKDAPLVDQAFPFLDAEGRSWKLAINLFAVKAVKEATGVNLLKLTDDKFAKLDELLGDEELLMDVIHVLCRDQFAAAGVDDQAFEKAIDGPTFGRAADAFMEAFINFSRDPRIQAALRSLWRKGHAAQAILMAEAEKEIEAITPEWMAQQSKERFGLSPAPSAASTPAPSASASSS